MEVSFPQGTENRGALQGGNAPPPNESSQPSLPSPFESREIAEFVFVASSTQQDCNQNSEVRPQQLRSSHAPGADTPLDEVYGTKGFSIPSPYPQASFPPSSCVPIPNIYSYPMVPAFDPRMPSSYQGQHPLYYPYIPSGVVPHAAMYPSANALQQSMFRLQSSPK